MEEHWDKAMTRKLIAAGLSCQSPCSLIWLMYTRLDTSQGKKSAGTLNQRGQSMLYIPCGFSCSQCGTVAGYNPIGPAFKTHKEAAQWFENHKVLPQDGECILEVPEGENEYLSEQMKQVYLQKV